MFARVLLVCVALCALMFPALADEPKEKKIKPIAVFHGSHSAIRGTEYAVAASEKEWAKLWDKHRGKEPDPLFTETFQDLEIDFDQHYVVAVFTGDGGYRCAINVRQRGDTIAVGVSDEIYSTEGRLPGAEDKRTGHEIAKEKAAARYVFVVLPKPVKEVVIEEDIEYRRGKASVWKERARFPAPKDKK